MSIEEARMTVPHPAQDRGARTAVDHGEQLDIMFDLPGLNLYIYADHPDRTGDAGAAA